MSNVKMVISNHNAKVLSKQIERPMTEQHEKTCICREAMTVHLKEIVQLEASYMKPG